MTRIARICAESDAALIYPCHPRNPWFSFLNWDAPVPRSARNPDDRRRESHPSDWLFESVKLRQREGDDLVHVVIAISRQPAHEAHALFLRGKLGVARGERLRGGRGDRIVWLAAGAVVGG